MIITSNNDQMVKLSEKRPLFTGQIAFNVLPKPLKFSGLKVDTVSFGNVDKAQSAETKMEACAIEMLKDKLHLKTDQPIIIRTDREFEPFVKILAREAYKMGSGEIAIETREPDLEKLRKEYKGEEFEWKANREKELKSKGAVVINFDAENSPYKKAKLTTAEIKATEELHTVKIPKSTQELLKIRPEEIIDAKLNFRPGQCVRICGEREHEPNILRLAEYAYKKGAKVVEVEYTQSGPNSLDKALLEHASQKTLTEIPEYYVNRFHEYMDKGTALLWLDGEDPKMLEGVDAERISARQTPRRKAIKFYYDSQARPWTIYYAPTTKSAISAYPEYKKGEVATKEEELAALKHAAKDATKINRVGKTREHVDNLQRVAKAINEMGIQQVHFISTDKDASGKPKTDLYIGIPSIAKFQAAETKTVPGDQPYVANTPTEEVFTSPLASKTRGYVSATMPLCLNGNMVEDIYVAFNDKGEISELKASKNEKLFREEVEKNEGGNRLGEVALVAGSPIFDLKRIFNSTLLDENATCHVAIGSAYPDCIKGTENIPDPEEMKKFLIANDINDSTTHVDFMIGGPNVIVEGIKADGSKVTLIKDNKFQV